MKNFDYAKKFHYMLKYIVLGFPLLLIGISLISYNSEFNSVLTLIKGLCNEFRNLELNVWYNNLLGVIEMNNITNDLLYILLTYPLYVLWIYIFDIIIDILGVVPRLAHKMISKVGGDY